MRRALHGLFLILGVVSVFGCARIQRNAAIDAGIVTPLTQKLYPLSCDEGFRYAGKALKTEGYTITEVVRSAAGGSIIGEKGGDTNTLLVKCQTGGVNVEAQAVNRWQKDSIQFSFNQIVDFGDKMWPPPKSLRIVADLVRGPEAKIEFPAEPAASGLSAVRFRILNGGKRVVQIDPNRVRASAGAAGKTAALEAADVQTRFGAADPAIASKLLKPTTLSQGTEVRGFVFFPAGNYTSATITVIDVETGEGDDFEFEFKP